MGDLTGEGRDFHRPKHLELVAVTPFPLVAPRGSLLDAIREGITASGVSLVDGDILVVTHKIVSRAEGRLVQLDSVVPSAKALQLAAETDRDPRTVEVILGEARELVRISNRHIITEHRLGHVSANAGVDRSNSAEGSVVCLLPRDPDGTAREISEFIRQEHGRHVAVLISDSHGRPFRKGTVGTCIGTYGLPPLLDLRGKKDLFSYTLERSSECIADELCAAANLLMGQADEGIPLVVIRGMIWPVSSDPIRVVLRSPEEDIFRDKHGSEKGT